MNCVNQERKRLTEINLKNSLMWQFSNKQVDLACVKVMMPDLEKVYEEYKEKGLNIIGVYSSFDMENDVDSVLDEAGTTYLILKYTEAFDKFQTGYVPTSVFINDKGEVVGETVIGSMSYEEWANKVEDLLK